MTEAAEIVPANAAHQEYWSSPAGIKWVTHQERLDRLFAEVSEIMMLRAATQPGESVIDIGCGTGDCALAAARAVAPGGRVLGVDISEPLVALARSRAAGVAGVDYIVADAQTHPFPPGFDLVISRFGVMFFDDPVAAFHNIAAALRPGGRMVLAAWAPMAENPWSLIAREAGAARLGPPPPSDPDAPGQFAFADTAKVTAILDRAGLEEPKGETLDVRLHVAGSTAEAAALCTSIGPVARLMAAYQGSHEDLAAITATVARALEPYRIPGGVAVPARITLFTARR